MSAETGKAVKTYFVHIIVILLASISLVAVISARGNPVVVAADLERIPMELAGYTGVSGDLPASVVRVLDPDAYLVRTYEGPEGLAIKLYIGYYGTAKGGRTGHNPNACLPGAGWGILEDRKQRLDPGENEGTLTVNYVLASKGPTYECMLHWYQSEGGRVFDSGFKQNVSKFVNKILRNRNSGAVVQVSAICDRESLDVTRTALVGFSEEIFKHLKAHWPKEA